MSYKNFRASRYLSGYINGDENFYGEFHVSKKTIKINT